MHFLLDTDGLENVYIKKENEPNSHIKLMRGKAYDVQGDKIESPFLYTMTAAKNKSPDLHAIYMGAYLMQQRLVEVLRGAGVDNLQDFPAKVLRQDTGEEVPGFVTFNVVGKVDCAAPAHSKSTPLANVVYYTDLVIFPSKARGHLMFRLEDSPQMILVHESVANAIQAAGFKGLTLTAVAEAVEP
jgi:hypothetical protein